MTTMQWTIRDYINPVTIQRYKSVLSRLLPNAKVPSDASTSGSHLLFFHPVTTALSADGYYSYQTPGSILNRTVPFRRRMWVQGSIEFKHPLSAGWHNCQEDLKFIKELKKDHFVALRRTVRDEKGVEVANEQRMLIYTNQPVVEASAKLRQLERFKNTHVVTFTDIDIMEYSSFSSNPHRIHWDRDYTRNVEGYRDIIVQGPFLVQFVIDYCEHSFGRSVSSIRYKNTSHVYAGTEVEVCDNGPESDGKVNIVLRDAKNPQKVYFESKVA